MDVYSNDDTFPIKDIQYRVYWSEKKRPFKKFTDSNPVAASGEKILYFTGPLGNLKRWLEDVGLPAGEELPKPVRAPKGSTQVQTINYGATKYNCTLLTGEKSLSTAYTANILLAEPNIYILPVGSKSSLYNIRKEVEALKDVGLLKDYTGDHIWTVYIPDHHTKVDKAIRALPGCIDRSLLLTLLAKPEADIMLAIANFEALTVAHRATGAYGKIDRAVWKDKIADDRLRTFIDEVYNINKAQTGNTNAWTLKDRLRYYPTLDFQGQAYTDSVEKLTAAKLRKIDALWATYEPLLEPALKGFNSINSWQYTDSALRDIVTDWVNIKAEAFIVASSTQQEVA